MASDLNPDVLHRLAKLGAQARLDQIEAERLLILGTFPGLKSAKPGPARAASPVAAATPAKVRRRRRKLNAAQRKAISARMSKLWAERRKAKGK